MEFILYYCIPFKQPVRPTAVRATNSNPTPLAAGINSQHSATTKLPNTAPIKSLPGDFFIIPADLIGLLVQNKFAKIQFLFCYVSKNSLKFIFSCF
jgi:hypothetical protein